MVPLMPMTLHQKIFSFVAGFFLFFFILELVRRRKLKEEYSWLWFLAGFGVALLVIKYELLGAISLLIGSKTETTTLFILSIIFLVLVNIFYAVKLSDFSNKIKNLAQKISLLEEKLKKKKSTSSI